MSDEDDDWFERALTDDEDEDVADGEGTDEDETDADGVDADGIEGDEVEGGDADGDDVEADDVGADDADGDGQPPGHGDGTDEGVAAVGEPPAEAAADAEDGELFEDDFASAFEGADDPGGGPTGGDAFGGGEGPGGDAFGGGEGPGGDVFGGGGGPGGDVFGGGEGDAFGGGGAALGGGGDEFGMGEFGMGGGSSTDFSEADFDSEIDRIDLGIEGLDDMIRGGVPDRSLMAVIGSAGTGKTTFGLQFLNQGLTEGERTIYISLEESRERVLRSAAEKGWTFEEYAEDGQLAVVDIDPIEMANSLSSIRSELPRLIDRFGATRLVLDSVSLLEMMYDDRATRRNEIYTFARSLKESGVTVLLTSEASEENPYASRHGIVEYLTDAVYVLQYVRPSDFRETRLAVEIQKIRDANHSREMKPYEITDDGLSVYRQANIF